MTSLAELREFQGKKAAAALRSAKLEKRENLVSRLGPLF